MQQTTWLLSDTATGQATGVAMICKRPPIWKFMNK